MASLADRSQSQHLDKAGGETDGETKSVNAVLDSSSTPEPDVADAASTSADVATQDSEQPGPAAPAVYARKPSVNSANLPQSKGTKSRGNPTVPKWGAAASESPNNAPVANGNGTSYASSSSTSSSSNGATSHDSPALSRMSSPHALGARSRSAQSVIAVSLDIPSDASVVSDAVKHVSKAKNVVIEASKAPLPNKATFMIKGGSPDTSESARQSSEVSSSPKISTGVEIPSYARSALIGTKGANLRAIERKYNVKIDSKTARTPEWSLERTLVNIEGNSISVNEAAEDVLKVVDKNRQVSSTREIAPELHPFMSMSDEWGTFVHQKTPKVTVQGSLSEAVCEMKGVDAYIKKSQSEYETSPFGTMDEKADSITVPTDLVLGDYGVLVIPSEKTLFGPAAALPKASKRVLQYLSSQKVSTIDISQAHDQSLAHARLLSRYFAATNALARFSKEYGVAISGPDLESGGVSYTFTGEEGKITLARKAFVKEVNTSSPASLAVVRGMRYRVVRKQAKKVLGSLTGPVSGFIGPSDELFLHYTEPEDEFTPDLAGIQRYMNEAIAVLAPVSESAKNVTKKTVKVGENNTGLSLKPLGPEARELYEEKIGNRDDVDIEIEDGNAIVISGLKDAVTEAANVVPKIVQSSRNYALRASHVEEFAIDAAVIGNLIGRQGSQIQTLRTKYDVKLEVDENNHVRIQGVESEVKACVKEISDIQRRWRDETTENSVIPAMYHAKSIGTKGKHVKRLRDQHQCIIRFPKSRQGSVDSYSDDDQASSAGTPVASGSTNANEDDVIMIKGPSRGVAAIKKEFLDLVAYEKSQSHSETIRVPASIVPRLVGRGGMAINSIRNETGTNINVGTSPIEDTGANGEELIEITVIGEKKSVDSAISQIQKSAEAASDTAEVTLEVDPELHRLLIGGQNSIRRELVAEAGGDPEQAGRILVVGVNGHDSPLVKIVGPSSVVEKLKTKVNKIIADAQRRSQASATLTFPRSRLRFISGSGGSKRREIEEQYDVYIQIPRDSNRGTGKDNAGENVTITVQGENNEVVEKVLAALRKSALPSEITTQIAAPSWTPKSRNNVQSQFGVRVEAISNNDRASSPTTPSAQPSGSNWVVETTNKKCTVQIMGETKEVCDKAAEYLQAHGNANTYGYLWIPQAKFRAIIGSGGKTINKSRNLCKANIEIPSVYSKQGSPIVIVGNPEQVGHAKELLEEAASQA